MKQFVALFGKIKKKKHSPEAEVHLYLEIVICDPLTCTMIHPRLGLSNKMEDKGLLFSAGIFLNSLDSHQACKCSFLKQKGPRALGHSLES